jgi:hypothetical protein
MMPLPNHVTLFNLAVDPPALWEEQRGRIGNHEASAPDLKNLLDAQGHWI